MRGTWFINGLDLHLTVINGVIKWKPRGIMRVYWIDRKKYFSPFLRDLTKISCTKEARSLNWGPPRGNPGFFTVYLPNFAINIIWNFHLNNKNSVATSKFTEPIAAPQGLHTLSAQSCRYLFTLRTLRPWPRFWANWTYLPTTLCC